MANLVVSAVSTFDNKGLKKATKEVNAFDKRIKSFAKTFATAFSVTQLTRFGKTAVRAFVDDERAAKALEQQLKNTGFQFSSPAVEMYISNLQKTTGVLDDQLRPAFQSLLTVTGSITTSQDALNTALNVSAATGKSLAQVTTALARAYAGNTTGLSRLGAGLDKTLLKTGDMNKIMGELNKKFAGQSAARLQTYAGKMDLLKVSAADATETIGKGLLDALTLIGKDSSIQNLTTDMNNFANATADVIVGLGKVISEIKKLGNIPGVGQIFDVRNIPVIGAYLGGLRQLGQNAQANGPARETPATGRILAFQRRQEAKAIKDSINLRKQEVKTLKEKSAVEQLKDKFDIERIGLAKALNEATNGEVKLRLKAQLAILDNNEALAKKLLAEMNAVKVTEEMIEALRAFTRTILDSIKAQLSALKALTAPNEQNLRSNIGTIIQSVQPAQRALESIINPSEQNLRASVANTLASTRPTINALNQLLAGAGIQRTSSSAPMDIRITVDGGGDKLSQAIAESIQVATRSGYSTVPAGFIV